MSRSAVVVVVALLAAALLAGCGSGSNSVSRAELEGKGFVSTSVTGHTLVPGTEISLQFTGTQLSAAGGCNTLVGPYTLKNDRLTQTTAAATMMACVSEHGDLSAQEAWLGAFLSNGADVRLDGKTMTLTGGGDTIKLIEGKPGGAGTSTAPPPTVGTRWVLSSTVSAGGTASSIPTDVERPALRFDPDGTATIFAGCNRGHGPAKVGDDGFATFGAIAMTRMHCSADANALERTVLGVLDGKVALGHQGADLSLAKNGEHLVYSGS